MSQRRGRAATLAAVVGAAGALAPALLLADPPPAVVAAAVAGACWWLAAQGPVALAQVAWQAAGDREQGVSQCRHLAGTGLGRQCRQRAAQVAGGALWQVPAAAAGASLAALGAQVRAGSLAVAGGGVPGTPLLLAAVVGPPAGIALGTLAGLAAPTRRHLAVAAVAAVVATVTTFLVRPLAPGAEPWAVAMPLGGVWPVTPGWSLDRYLVLHTGLHRRLISAGAWTAVVTLLAGRRIRAGAARRTAPPADLP